MTDAAAPTALAKARECDVEHRQRHVHQALAELHTDASEITISSVAPRARVHRPFSQRHPELYAAVLAAASHALTVPSPASTATSHRSVLTENANQHQQNRHQAQHIRDLEDRLSDLIGHHLPERSGLGAATNIAASQTETDRQCKVVANLTRALHELGAAPEATRRLMAELNRNPGATPKPDGRQLQG